MKRTCAWLAIGLCGLILVAPEADAQPPRDRAVASADVYDYSWWTRRLRDPGNAHAGSG